MDIRPLCLHYCILQRFLQSDIQGGKIKITQLLSVRHQHCFPIKVATIFSPWLPSSKDTSNYLLHEYLLIPGCYSSYHFLCSYLPLYDGSKGAKWHPLKTRAPKSTHGQLIFPTTRARNSRFAYRSKKLPLPIAKFHLLWLVRTIPVTSKHHHSPIQGLYSRSI